VELLQAAMEFIAVSSVAGFGSERAQESKMCPHCYVQRSLPQAPTLSLNQVKNNYAS
jgi:hypothetical protein